jgi:hypothetical protein
VRFSSAPKLTFLACLIGPLFKQDLRIGFIDRAPKEEMRSSSDFPEEIEMLERSFERTPVGIVTVLRFGRPLGGPGVEIDRAAKASTTLGLEIDKESNELVR